MGESTYYLTAEFESEEKLNENFDSIKKFIKQGQKAEDFWQNHRYEKREIFWKKFKAKFPIVYEYLGELADKDNNNGLAGELDFGMDKEIPTKNKNILEFSDMVWHIASWDRFADFLKKKFEAKNVEWFNNERYD
jgi:ABC-type nitrate/sulfonate/bicarbonate transport system substrate-binding protein